MGVSTSKELYPLVKWECLSLTSLPVREIQYLEGIVGKNEHGYVSSGGISMCNFLIFFLW